jgi:hypothetical protein
MPSHCCFCALAARFARLFHSDCARSVRLRAITPVPRDRRHGSVQTARYQKVREAAVTFVPNNAYKQPKQRSARRVEGLNLMPRAHQVSSTVAIPRVEQEGRGIPAPCTVYGAVAESRSIVRPAYDFFCACSKRRPCICTVQQCTLRTVRAVGRRPAKPGSLPSCSASDANGKSKCVLNQPVVS